MNNSKDIHRSDLLVNIVAFMIAGATACFVSNIRPILAYLVPDPDFRPYSFVNLILNLPFIFLLITYFVSVRRVTVGHGSISTNAINILLIVASIAICIFAFFQFRLS